MSTGTLLGATNVFLDWSVPGPIGTLTPNTGAFTSLSGSRSIVPGTLADGTTLSLAMHGGRCVQINGGTIGLPADANWSVGDEFELISVGTNPTTLAWTGNLILTSTSSAASQVVSGLQADSLRVKKISAGVAYLLMEPRRLNWLIDDVTLTNPTTDDVLRYDSALNKWANTPGNDSIYDLWNRAEILSGSGTTITQRGISLTNVGTISHSQPAAGTAYTQAHRFLLTSAATAAAFSQIRSAMLRLWRGSAAGLGGFKVSIAFGLGTLQAGMRSFVGIDSNNAAQTNVDPTTTSTTSKIGLAINNNTGNWNLINNVAGTAPTVLALGTSFPVDVTTLYTLELVALPNGSSIAYRVINRNTGAVATGSLTTNIPANTTYMHINGWATNNATAAAVAITFGRVLAEFG